MGTGRAPVARQGSQILLSASSDGTLLGSPGPAASAAASVVDAKAARMARQLNEAHQEIDAMSIKLQQQVAVFASSQASPVRKCR